MLFAIFGGAFLQLRELAKKNHIIIRLGMAGNSEGSSAMLWSYNQ